MLVLWPPRALIAAFCCGGVLTTAIVAGAGVIALSGFDAAWNQLHAIAFSNDFWQLDPNSDHLIQMFPEAFWQRISLILGLVTLFEAVAVSGATATFLVLTRLAADTKLDLPVPEIAGPAGHARPRLSAPDPWWPHQKERRTGRHRDTAAASTLPYSQRCKSPSPIRCRTPAQPPPTALVSPSAFLASAENVDSTRRP